ncbi:hypothetical protein L484_016188 [Morus notabilis]|uniref:Uncharacterized protein n=1 Tax=Morus notabilis TaxID=981085 RepID=W9S6A0_9ROSA|nr:hypothetical protein L484_016188 [Morus notabilis]
MGSIGGQKTASVENGGLLVHFFGNDGKACLRHEKFVQFLRDLHNEAFEEFKEFEELRKKLESFSPAIFSYGKVNGVLTKNDFRRAASQVVTLGS